MPTQAPASVAMYPSLDELLDALTESSRTMFGEPLRSELRRRYDLHGWEYDSGKKHTDSRPRNACLDNDSIADAREELVDAVFNLVVQLFKDKIGAKRNWRARSALLYILTALNHLS